MRDDLIIQLDRKLDFRSVFRREIRCKGDVELSHDSFPIWQHTAGNGIVFTLVQKGSKISHFPGNSELLCILILHWKVTSGNDGGHTTEFQISFQCVKWKARHVTSCMTSLIKWISAHHYRWDRTNHLQVSCLQRNHGCIFGETVVCKSQICPWDQLSWVKDKTSA